MTLKGTYFSPGRPGPAVLLLHQCNLDRRAWDDLAADLGNAGFHVLTVDYRGYGESGGASDPDQRRAERSKWPADIDAMLAYLLARPGADRSNAAAGGASCSVAQSSDLAARSPAVKALIELSGTASDTGKAYVAGAPGVAVFGAAARDDGNAPKGITELVSASKHPRSTLKIYDGSEHGVPMFPRNPDLRPAIVSWLQAVLMGGDRTH
jgi:dienelactone hydrolase